MPGQGESTLRPGLEQSDVTPGIEGFLFTALMVAMVIVVLRLMVRSVRRVQYRSADAEDMLVERYQGHLAQGRHRDGGEPGAVQEPGVQDPQNPQDQQGTPARTSADLDRQKTRLQQKYPGYLDGPEQEPKAPDSGRD